MNQLKNIPKEFSEEKPSPKLLERMMAKGGVQLRSSERDQLWQYHEMLRDADTKLNLTRIRAFGAMVEKHYIDSMLAGYYVDLQGPVMDLGSGGGFPGIPLAIKYPKIKFKLVEGRRLRAGFLMNVQRELKLNNVEVIARKLNPDDAMNVTSVITRAFSAIPDTLERIENSVVANGYAVFMKGPNCDEEMEEASSFQSWTLEDDIHYLLPFTRAERRMVVYKKKSGSRQIKSRPTEIVSADNSRIKTWKKLTTAKGIRKENKTLITGERYINELQEQCPGLVQTIIETDKSNIDGPENVLVSRDIMRELDQIAGTGPLAVVNVPAIPTWNGELNGPGPTLILPNQLPENIGAMLRTAEALGVQQVVLLAEAAYPFLPKSLRASGPAPWRMHLATGPSLKSLGDIDQTFIALDLAGQCLSEFKEHAPDRYGLIVGLEGAGTRDLDTSIHRITIPTATHVDSLNAAVACGIALYSLKEQEST